MNNNPKGILDLKQKTLYCWLLKANEKVDLQIKMNESVNQTENSLHFAAAGFRYFIRGKENFENLGIYKTNL